MAMQLASVSAGVDVAKVVERQPSLLVADESSPLADWTRLAPEELGELIKVWRMCMHPLLYAVTQIVMHLPSLGFPRPREMKWHHIAGELNEKLTVNIRTPLTHAGVGAWRRI
jgi:hypothetical protein